MPGESQSRGRRILFSEPIFFLFFAIVFSGYWLLRSNTARKQWLFVASYVFYGAWDWRFLFLIFGSTSVDYVVGLLLPRYHKRSIRRTLLITSLVVNLGALGFFKYYNFFVSSGTGLLSWLGIETSDATLSIVLPVGISFFTFQSMSYTIDIYRGKLAPIKVFDDFALYVAFFPQLVAGPIVRATEFLPQLETKRVFSNVDVRAALTLFLVGFIKKVCIADNLAVVVDEVYGAVSDYSASSISIAAIAYSIQIYCDFSGYTDMAIATAALLGYKLPTNFRWPYFATNIQDFWQRWHISLSTWLRDYLYIPLGGNRGKSKLTAHRNIMLTMLLGGLWHGASWNYVLWGGLHGFALIVHRESGRILPNSKNLALTILGTALTFYWVTFALIIFRATSLSDAIIASKAFIFWSSPGTRELSGQGACVVIFLLLAIAHYIARTQLLTKPVQSLPTWAFAFGYGVIVMLLLPFYPLEYRPFVYFQF